MICPDCRLKPWYWASLSDPNLRRLVYVCQHCDMLILRGELDKLDAKILSRLGMKGGVRILTLKLAERGYTLPPSKVGGLVKASRSLKREVSASPSKGEGC